MKSPNLPTPAKVRAVLRLYKKGPFKAGKQFRAVATAGQLFKAKGFARIDNADAFTLHSAKVDGKEQLLDVMGVAADSGLTMLAFTSPNAQLSWPTCMHPETIELLVKATADVDEFSCELEGLSVRSLGDAETHDYDRNPLDVTLGT